MNYAATFSYVIGIFQRYGGSKDKIIWKESAVYVKVPFRHSFEGFNRLRVTSLLGQWFGQRQGYRKQERYTTWSQR